ncbi:hypothetical protein [Lacihabitans sp. CS3-21]|jgi:hypothetical protein|uniref:hypothetical protein n=1 Tax=Lacihabitans sp. CS3-21 TaxID=2487332 RepID=UPI0020CCE40D|nr:hypothetical protein [Lacihabitans sp. CS3-21]MCP9749023.1 hypothetical protein [Lacihabitans sp. CS3-21]
METNYDETEFVAYALGQMDLKILERKGNVFELENGFTLEVERKDLYKLSSEGWVISPFDDIGHLIDFVKKNTKSTYEG